MSEEPAKESSTEPAPGPKVDRTSVGLGIALLVTGLVLAVGRLEIFDFRGAVRLWPLLLVAFGAWWLVVPPRGKERRGGAVMMLMGAWLLLNFVGLFGFGFHNSWPLIPMMFGLLGVVWPKDAESCAGGLVLFAVGAWLLAVTQHIWGLEWRNAWPLLLVVVGISIALGGVIKALPVFMRRRS